MRTTFMKRLRRLVSSLIQRLKQRPKISPLSNTENNFKFSKGDRVIIKGYENFKNKSGTILDIVKPNGYKVSLGYPGYLNFPENELIFEDTSKERDWKLKQVLDESI